MAERIEVPVARFAFSGKGHYVSKPDRRELFQILHPWTTSEAGDFGQMEAEVAVPEDAQGPFTLAFYVMDNNYTGPEETGADWINREVRVGHRFRQALLNGEVVWQQDTCLDDVSQHTLVGITEKVKPGETLRLAFRLWEAADSDVVLPGDVHVAEHYATKVATAVKQVVKDRYETRSYWGDVAVYTGARAKPEEVPWGWQTVLKAPAPALHEVKAATRESAILALEHAELLDGPWPWPVQQGISFPMGALKDESRIALQQGGRAIPAEVRRLNAWPDGSVQWAVAAFGLAPHRTNLSDPTDRSYGLAYGTQVRASRRSPQQPVAAEGAMGAANGLVGLQAAGPEGAAGPLAVLAGGRTVVPGVAPYLRAGGKNYAVRWSAAKWLARSPQSAELALSGELVASDGDRYGACRIRAALFAGCPYVRILFTITNQRPEKTFSAEAYGLKLPVPAAARRSSPRRTRLARGLPGAAGEGWASVDAGGASVTAVVRWFGQQWPNGIEVGPEGIDLQCFKPGDARLATYDTHPGEAKTQEIWLAFTPQAPSAEDCRKLAALVETPPRLDVSALIRESRAWGELPAITKEQHPEVHEKVEAVLAPYFAKCKEGIRLFGEYGNWDNYYWNTLHTMHTLYAMTGERRWVDWAERAIRHHFDVDICHWQPAEGAVGAVGAMHGYWGDHSDTPCYSLIQNCDGAFDHWNLTGDPDAYGYGVGIAEYVRTDEKIGRGGSTREQGWPVICMLAAWRQTGEAKFGDHAKLLVETALGFEERRRGTYIENHGSVSYLGPTPFMYGILCTALRQYHLRTGDERAAILIARLANAVYEESHDPFHSKTLPNIDYYYSPNPYLRGGDGFTPITTLNLNIASAQAYGAYVTQDAGLADIARRSWQAGLEGGSVYAEMAYDLAGIIWWLDRLQER